MLLAAEGGSVQAVADAAGLEWETVNRLRDKTATRVQVATERAILGLTPARVRRCAAHVPSRRAVQRIKSLQALGWPLRDLGARLGYAPTVRGVPFIFGRYPLISQALDRRVEDLYDQLWDTPGPSPIAAARAAREGWRLPLYYDDDGYPASRRRRESNYDAEQAAAVKIEALRLLVNQRLGQHAVAVRLGLTGCRDRQVERAKQAVGLRTYYDSWYEDSRVRPECEHLVPLIRQAGQRVDLQEDAVRVWADLLAACQAANAAHATQTGAAA
jgi:hypothetical protein